MPTVNLSATLGACDAVIIGSRPGRTSASIVSDAIPTAKLKSLEAALKAVNATGKADEVITLPANGAVSAEVIVVVGLGKKSERTRESLRRSVGAGVRALANRKRVAIALPVESATDVDDIATGALLGAYSFTEFKSGKKDDTALTKITIVTKSARTRAFVQAAERATVVADAVNLARDLVNTPPGHLPPAQLVARAKQAAKGLPITIEVLDEKALARKKSGGILAVGQGSANPPRLAIMKYAPRGAKAKLALVGKGITFDSGGLSLKPPQAMETMKCDMGGAAAVIAAVTAIAALGLKVNVTGYLPTAENMPSGTAQRPGDIITMYGGTTVEVLNTDAEGRLILGDALVMACENKPDVIVDAATLTGAQAVALGSRTSGVMGNNDAFRTRVVDVSSRAGEMMWPMPLPADLRPSLDSPVADLANIGDRMGGMLTAGLFLAEFVKPEIPWVHLDIAGPAFNEGAPYGYTPKGGTGAAVRTFISLAEDLAESGA